MMTEFPKPDSKKARRARERARQQRLRKFRKDVFEATSYGKCEKRGCKNKGSSPHHIEKRHANSPELDVRENGILFCYVCHDKAECGDGDFSADEFVLLVLQPYMTPGTVKHLQWHKAYDKLKEKVRNKRLSGKLQSGDLM